MLLVAGGSIRSRTVDGKSGSAGKSFMFISVAVLEVVLITEVDWRDCFVKSAASWYVRPGGRECVCGSVVAGEVKDGSNGKWK